MSKKWFLVTPRKCNHISRMWCKKLHNGNVVIATTLTYTKITPKAAKAEYRIVRRKAGGYQHPSDALARRLDALIAA
jgi:hypothetical protein